MAAEAPAECFFNLLFPWGGEVLRIFESFLSVPDIFLSRFLIPGQGAFSDLF